MTDCGAVRDWIETKDFRDETEVVEYARQNDSRWGKSGGNLDSPVWGNFWDCVREYDFDTELRLVKVRIHSKKKGTYTQEQLRRIDRERKIFLALDLDPSTRARVRELLRSGF